MSHLRSAVSFHRERVSKAIAARKAMLARMLTHNPDSLPDSVDLKKLEDAYKDLDGYEFVLRKKAVKKTFITPRINGLFFRNSPKE